MENVYQQFGSMESDHYQAMAQILAKVAEESCLWVSVYVAKINAEVWLDVGK